MTHGQSYVLLLAPLLAALAAFIRRRARWSHWAHDAWFPLAAGAVAAALEAAADLARTGTLSGFTAVAALIGAATSALAAYRPEPPADGVFEDPDADL